MEGVERKVLDNIDIAGMLDFIKDLVKTPSYGGKESDAQNLVNNKLEEFGFTIDKWEIDFDKIKEHPEFSMSFDRKEGVGLVGILGEGKKSIILCGHVDTVAPGEEEHWDSPPLELIIEDKRIIGRGVADMKGGLAAMIYGAKLLQETALRGNVVVACVVQEETCEGLGTRTLVEDSGSEPDWGVLGEPTNLNVSRGQRGRLEMRVVAHGKSAHAASPQLGENAIYVASRLVFGLELLAGQLGDDDFLGTGSLAVTEISSRAGSRNAIPDRCTLIIDRRLTLGENETKALAEVQRVIAREGVSAEVTVPSYETATYTGHACKTREFYPAWVIAADHPLVEAAVQAAQAQLKRRPHITRWGFSTEGVYTAGEANIPTVGFGPGREELAHTSDEHVRVDDVYAAAEVYARLAALLLE